MRARLLAVLSAGLLAAGGTAVAPSAAAAPSEQGLSSRSTTADERAAVRAYWTPERMARAVPGGTRVEAMAKPTKPGGGSGGSGGTVALTDVGPTTQPAPTEGRTVGKVFFSLGGRNYVCSGSVVASGSDSLVLTAGHCLHEGRGGSRGFASNFLFVPGYSGGNAPYEKWASVSLHTTSAWASSGDFVYDVGFAKVERRSTTLEARVGGYGIDFGRASAGTATTSWGYPAAGDYTGETLETCAGPTRTDPYGRDTQGIPCGLTGGSSGGPWINGGNGLAHSVNSYKYTSGPYTTHMFGPYFTETARSLYNAVQG